jgi:two-component system, sensor histidine kinase PdtaS
VALRFERPWPALDKTHGRAKPWTGMCRATTFQTACGIHRKCATSDILSGLARDGSMLRTFRKWPLSASVATTVAAVVAACLFQLPIEREVPGEPFLLFVLVIIASSFAFGASAGFVGVAVSTIFSILFFEPVGSLALSHATDLIRIEFYALLASCAVIASARLGHMVIAASENADNLQRLNESKTVLLRELAHGVANNFASVAAFLSVRSDNISDTQARSVLAEAVEQIRMMGQVHARLRAGDRQVSLGSQDFFENLCGELEGSVARGRQISIRCEADDVPLSAHRAISLGLIVNELVMNAVKYAFPGERTGRIRIVFEVLSDDQLRLCVEDNGVGFTPRQRRNVGLGQDLINGISHELGGGLEIKTSEKGSSFHLRIPYTSPHPSTVPSEPTG